MIMVLVAEFATSGLVGARPDIRASSDIECSAVIELSAGVRGSVGGRIVYGRQVGG